MTAYPLENFLSLTQKELYGWLEKSVALNLSAGFDKETTKAMLEEEVLLWIHRNHHSIETEKEVLGYLQSL